MSTDPPPNVPRDEFRLAIPPEPSWIGTARLFAASIARHYGVDEQSVEDLKIAVSEACTSAILARRGTQSLGPVHLRADRAAQRLDFQADDLALVVDEPSGLASVVSGASSSDDLTRHLGLETIRALFPEATVVPNERDGTDLRFGMAIPGESPPE